MFIHTGSCTFECRTKRSRGESNWDVDCNYLWFSPKLKGNSAFSSHDHCSALSNPLTKLLIGTFEFPVVSHQLLTDFSISSVSEIYGAAINRPECLHSHSHRWPDVLFRLPRLLRSYPRVAMHVVIGEIIFIGDLMNVDIHTSAIRCYFNTVCRCPPTMTFSRNFVMQILD